MSVCLSVGSTLFCKHPWYLSSPEHVLRACHPLAFPCILEDTDTSKFMEFAFNVESAIMFRFNHLYLYTFQLLPFILLGSGRFTSFLQREAELSPGDSLACWKGWQPGCLPESQVCGRPCALCSVPCAGLTSHINGNGCYSPVEACLGSLPSFLTFQAPHMTFMLWRLWGQEPLDCVLI